MDITHITSLLGGIALFLYGMSIMGAGLEKLAGGKMQGVLQKLTSSTIKGVIFGTLITGVIQSSAGTVVICVGLVNSGIMTLTQSVGVIMGANIGTTVTGQLIRMADISGDSLWLTLIQPKTFAPVVAFIGCIFYVFLRSAKRKNIGQIMLGFGILFTGMSLMDTGVAPLRESAVFQNLFVTMTNPVLGILVGVVVTVIIQSSSASVGILQALSSTGLVTFSSAIPIILGAHIGTAFTPLLTIGGSSKDGKRAALIHLYFNIIGSVILLALVYAVQFTVGIPMWNDVMNKSTIANIHTLSSVCAMLLFLPCSGVLSKLALLTVPDSAEEAQELSMPVLDERLFKSPAVALQQAKSAVIKMSRRAARNVNLAAPLLLKMDEDTVSAIRVRENLIDRMEVAISNYLIKMTDQELGDDESHTVTELLNFVTEFERIGDYAVNIMEKAEELQARKSGETSAEQFDLFIILRTELDNSKKISKMLYLLQDELELENTLSGYNCQQAFVFGNGAVQVKTFQNYRTGFRCQFPQTIREYSSGEALIIGTDLMKEKKEELLLKNGENHKQQLCLYILMDGRIKNDQLFQIALNRLQKLKEEGVKLCLRMVDNIYCEACQKLKDIVEDTQRCC